MLAVVLYTLAALGGLTVVGCAVLLVACVRIAQADRALHERGVEDAGATTRDSAESLTSYTTFI